MKEAFDHIKLTDEETTEALRNAREIKHYLLKRKAYLEEVSSPRQFKSFTAEEVKKSIEDSGFVIDSFNEEITWLLCLYFTKDERFELEGFKLDKGIMLFGGVGVGKTTLMKKLFKNQHQSFIIKMCREVEDEYAQDGDSILTAYGHVRQASFNGDPFGHRSLGYCFDDLGTEPMGKYYGKQSNVMAEIILNRYDRDVPFNQTHLTTNLTIEEVKERYGSRVTDRMRQMFNLIGFKSDAPSRRK